jgi:hypothetical protein
MAGIAYGEPERSSAPVPSRWVDTEVFWTGVDGSEWELTDDDAGVILLAEGVEGFHMPRFKTWVRQSPALPGQRFTGAVAEPRDVLLPLLIVSDSSSKVWMDRDRKFWKSVHPAKYGTLRVRAGGTGSERTLQCRFVPEEYTFPWDPALAGWAKYALLLQADQPFWAGRTVTSTWKGDVGTQEFYEETGPHLININFGHQLSKAKIKNAGDEDAWPVWKIIGPATTASVGIAGSIVDIPFEVEDGKALVLDTNPAVQTALLCDYTPASGSDPAEFDDPEDVTHLLTGRVDFRSIPAGETKSLQVAITGAGKIQIDLTPLYWRAW